MGILTPNTAPTGDDLAQEFEESIASIAERQRDRQAVVRQQIAALQSEDSTLSGLGEKLTSAGA